MNSPELFVKIALEELISRLELNGCNRFMDAAVVALISSYKADFDLSHYEERHRALRTMEYMNVLNPQEKNYELMVEYANAAIENAKKEHYKIYSMRGE